jgi:Na+-transporting NADH:ubiquinone oxidoreductase subunit NqrC
MAKYNKEEQKQHFEKVRRLLVFRKNMNATEIATALGLERKYAGRIKKKVVDERTIRYANDTAKKVDKEIAYLEDNIEVLKADLQTIINDKNASEASKVAAIRTIVKNYQTLIQLKFDAGLFERQLGSVTLTGDEELTKLLDKYAEFIPALGNTSAKQPEQSS